MKFEFSAGGIVLRKNNDNTEILVAQHSQHHGWVFPKGLIGDHNVGEGKEDTAIREVKEETGVSAKILEPLSAVEFWYVFKGDKVKKTVYYYLMEYVKGNTKHHDFEMEKVEWLPQEQVEERLTFDSDKKAWSQARKLI